MILIGFILGWIFGNIIGGKSSGKKGLIHWDWFLDTFKIHLHHWIIMIIILIMYIIILEESNDQANYNSYIVGFLLGGIAQGLSYKDRFEIFL